MPMLQRIIMTAVISKEIFIVKQYSNPGRNYLKLEKYQTTKNVQIDLAIAIENGAKNLLSDR